MPTNFPTALDDFTNPTAADNLNTPAVLHSAQHANLNDAVEALQAKVGADGSAVATSIDYLLAQAIAALNALTAALGTAAYQPTSAFDPAGAAAAAQAASQPLDATLTAFAGLTIAANSLTIGTGSDAFSQTTFAANTFPARASSGNLAAKTITDFALTVLDDADAATVRATIGAGVGTVTGTGTDKHLMRWSGTADGQDSNITCDDTTGALTCSAAKAGGRMLSFTNTSTTTNSTAIFGAASAATGAVLGIYGSTSSSDNASYGGFFGRGGSTNVGLSAVGCDLLEMNAPNTPPTGMLRLYASSADSLLYYKTDGGTVVGPLGYQVNIAGNAETVTVADTTDSTCFVAMFESATGNLAVKTDAELSYDASTHSLSVGGDLTVSGNLTVNGNTVTVNTATISVEDPLIEMGVGNTANTVDLGFYVNYQPSATPLFGGLFRDASNSGKWTLFDSLEAEPTTTVNTSGTGYAIATLIARIEGVTVSSANNAYAGSFTRGGTDNVALHTEGMDFGQTDVPASPPTLHTRLYADIATGYLYYKSSSGVVTGPLGYQVNITGNAATVTTNANLTGPVTSIGNATTIANGVVTEAMQVLADNTTNNVSTTKHGYVPKGTNVGNFLKDDGTWATPGAAGEYCELSETTHGTYTTITAISWDTEVTDTSGMHDNSTNPARITVITTGVHLITADVRMTSTTPGAAAADVLSVRINGTVVAENELIHTANAFKTRLNIAIQKHLTAGDYIEICITMNSGSAQTEVANVGVYRLK